MAGGADGLEHERDRLDLVVARNSRARSACWAATAALASTLMMWTSPRFAQSVACEGRQGAGGLEAAVIRDDNRAIRKGVAGTTTIGRGVFFKTFFKRLVTFISRAMKRKCDPRASRIRSQRLRFGCDQLVGRADRFHLRMRNARLVATCGELLQKLIDLPMDIRQPSLVTHVINGVHAGRPAHRPSRLDRSNPRLIDDPQPHERGPDASSPANPQLNESGAMLERIEADQDAAKHEIISPRASRCSTTPDIERTQF